MSTEGGGVHLKEGGVYKRRRCASEGGEVSTKGGGVHLKEEVCI